MAAKRVSRLEKIEAKRARRAILVYSGLTVTLIALLFLFGIGAISGASEFVVSIFGNDSSLVFSDNTPPAPPRIDTPDDYTSDSEIRLTGSAEQNATVTILLNGKSKEILVDASGSFTTEIELTNGENEISAFTTDQAGNESSRSKTFIIVFDNQKPELVIVRPTDGQTISDNNNITTIEGSTNEEAKITINGRFVVVNDDNSFTYDYQLSEGENELIIVATDMANNSIETTLRVTYSP